MIAEALPMPEPVVLVLIVGSLVVIGTVLSEWLNHR